MRSRIQNCKKSMKFDSFICDLQIREHRFIVSLWLQKIKEHPRNQNCMLCDLYLCLKSFLAIKSDRKSNLICSLIRDLQIVGGHICNVCLMTILSSHKQNVEYSTAFGYEKGIQHDTRHVFWSATSTLKLWVVSFAMFDSWPFYQAKSWKT